VATSKTKVFFTYYIVPNEETVQPRVDYFFKNLGNWRKNTNGTVVYGKCINTVILLSTNADQNIWTKPQVTL